MSIKLIVVGGKLAGTEIPVRSAQFVIGRDESCQLRPNSNVVSKLHCAIVVADGVPWLRDLKSTNGTFHNGNRVEDRVLLADGDKIRVGPLVLEVRLPQVKAGEPAEIKTKEKPKPAPAEPKAEKEKTQVIPTKSDKPKEKVAEEDIFEWLSDDDEGLDEAVADLGSAQTEHETQIDISAFSSETVPELGESKKKVEPASDEQSTTAAADRLLKGMMVRKRT